MKLYVEKSHKRCKTFGIERSQVLSKRILKDDELMKRLHKEQALIQVAAPFLNDLYDFVKGSEFFAILTDREGCILNMVGDEEILEEAFAYKMVPGAFMDEPSIGTNAMGTALYEDQPVQVSGEEHFIEAYHQWTCSSAPIHNVNGDIIGSIDLTGYSSSVHPHTLGMVVAAAHAIEKILEGEDYNRQLSDSKKYAETIVNSIPSAILTVDLKGKIHAFNPSVNEMLGFSDKELLELDFHKILPSFEEIKSKIVTKKSLLDEEIPLNSKLNKVQFNVSIYPILNARESVYQMVVVIKDIKKVRKLANKIMGRRAIYTFDKIIGSNESFLNAVDFAKKVANSKSTVLIMGESGTGKEIFAQAIQNYSNRSDEPFVAINCGAIPKNLIESELFGYEEGAFTGAKRSGQPGKFEIADGGTVFLDEIGEMPLDMQTRLLRVIEESTVSRIGSSTEIPVDVRIIAATNKDLIAEVSKGNFRKDLFYRLNVLPIRLPSLRERREDIPALVDYFMDRVSRKLNKSAVVLPEAYLSYLKNYNWPGNIRELENLIELIINTETIPAYESLPEVKIEKKSVFKSVDLHSLESMEKRHIQDVLNHFGGNITSAAKVLNIGRNTLYRKIEKHCIDLEQCSIVEQ
ncbi:PAS domain S-box protein [Acidaminobacter sp. JC074]|uniref:sigma-54-dependent Fis family transcriptional regulator n=1 Tax=Acidaminobacter sp. JC074 TaxID=2530199 RepID=UPI001F0FFA69|nr:sigma 54-interacting transcriptional regulator [Acidaminobacter sp. JC074]MCH4889400.1 PAS domain S-box protein [Acidaminobacter sp. JC074]